MIAPCIVCGGELDGLGGYVEGSPPYFNQPEGGTGFTTQGNYGSTVFDPMNGNTLSISVCDDCLTTAGKNGRVLLGRDWKPVVAVLEGSRRPIIVGQVPVQRALTVWDPAANVEDNEEGDDAPLEIEPEEVGVMSGVQWWAAFDPARKR